MGLSLTHLIILLVIVFVFFGAGKLPKMMGDIGKGVRNMREGLKGEEDDTPKQVSHQAEQPTPKVKEDAETRR